MEEIGQRSKEEMEEMEEEENEISEVDAKGFTNYVKTTISHRTTLLSTAGLIRNRQTTSASAIDETVYNMNHARRGVALIFNHEVFFKLLPRSGTNKDCDDLDRQLRRLGFEVRIYKDFQRSKIRSVLRETAQEDHSDADCLLICVMTHGESGLIHAIDGSYREELLWWEFTGDRCPSLLGKPKLIFIQACRGEEADAGVRIVSDCTDSSPTTYYQIPSQADILVAHATVKEYFSFRSSTQGSWFVQALCKELQLNGFRQDLLTLLTFVIRRVATENTSHVPDNKHKDKKVQMPTFTTTLTRLLYFPSPQESPQRV